MTMPLLRALTSLGTRIGWYAYAPLSGQAFQPQGAGEPAWLRLIIWLAAIGSLDANTGNARTAIPCV